MNTHDADKYHEILNELAEQSLDYDSARDSTEPLPFSVDGRVFVYGMSDEDPPRNFILEIDAGRSAKRGYVEQYEQHLRDTGLPGLKNEALFAGPAERGNSMRSPARALLSLLVSWL